MLKTEPSLKWHGDWETKPMENLHGSLCTFKKRKVIMCECWRGPPINILSTEISSMSSHLNVENWTRDGVAWWGGNWVNKKQKTGMGLYEKLEKWLPFQGKCHTTICQITKSPQSLGLCFSKCQQKRKFALAIMKKMEEWFPFHK